MAENTGEPLTSRGLLRLSGIMGVAGFGGGVAVLSVVRRELVEKRRALSDGEFLKYLALAQSLPGGIAINLFTQLGFRAGGMGTALACTVLFILPSAVLMALLAHFYAALSRVPRMEELFVGLNASVLAVVGAAAIQLGRHMPRRVDFLIAALVALAVSFRVLTVLETVLLVTLGASVASAWHERRPPPTLSLLFALPLPKTLAILPALTVVFLQIGLSLFGGGLAMIPMLDHQLVARGWLSTREFQDVVTFSQLTPGPIATACTFVGYRLAGPGGALAATVAVFLPPFVLSVIAARSVTRFEHSPTLRAVLAALGPASVGLIAAAAVSLAQGQLSGVTPWVFTLGSLFFLLMFDAPPLLVLVVAGTLRALSLLWMS